MSEVQQTHLASLHDIVTRLEQARERAEALADRAYGPSVPIEPRQDGTASGVRTPEPDTLPAKLNWMDRELGKLGQALARLEDVA